MNDAMRDEIERYLAGGMTPEEARPFLESVRQDPQALVLLGRALEDQAYLYDALRVRPEAEPRPAHDTARILKTRRLMTGRRPPGGPAAGWIMGAVAAAAVLLLLYTSTTPSPRPPVRTPVARVVEVPAPAPAPTPSPVAPAPEPKRVRVDPLPTPPPPSPRVDVPVPAPPAPKQPEPVAPSPLIPPPLPREKPAPTVVMPPEPPKRIIARIDQAAAGTALLDASGPKEARAGLALVSGQGLETGAEGGTRVRFPDGTKIDLAPHTLLREIVDDPATGKNILVAWGTLTSEISKQPTGKPLLFTTPHAVARVLGTTLKLAVDEKSTRLDVREGKVQLRRTSDNKAVDVAAGSFAVAGEGADFVSRPSPIDEILLVPTQGEIGGGEWRLIADPAAAGGIAFEALRTSNRQPFKQSADSARVTWVFRADAGRDYTVWIRGCTTAKVDPIKHDAVAVEFPESKVTEQEGVNKGMAGGPDRALFNGYFMRATGYWWVGGDADANLDEQHPVVVRFNRPGLQSVRLYAMETPIRIDAIWISATQKTRPDAQGGPAVDRK